MKKIPPSPRMEASVKMLSDCIQRHLRDDSNIIVSVEDIENGVRNGLGSVLEMWGCFKIFGQDEQ